MIFLKHFVLNFKIKIFKIFAINKLKQPNKVMKTFPGILFSILAFCIYAVWVNLDLYTFPCHTKPGDLDSKRTEEHISLNVIEKKFMDRNKYQVMLKY